MGDSATIVLRGEDKNMQAALQRSETGFNNFGASVKKVFAIIGAAIVAKKLFDFGSKLLMLYAEQEAAEARLGAVIKATGGAAGFSLEKMKEMASAMQDITKHGDEVVLGSMAIIATFKNIRGDEFRDATLLAADMAEVLQTDLKGASTQVAKALNDPLKGITALSRAGVSFTDTQKTMIETLVNSGDVIGAQRIILEELRGEFGGAAEAAGDTFGGQLAKLKNRVGDVGERIGKALVPVVMKLIPLIEGAANVIEWLADKMAIGIEGIVEWSEAIPGFLKPAFEWLVDAAVVAFTVIEWRFANFRDIFVAGLVALQLAFVKSWNVIVHWLTKVVPDHLDWFARNWASIFTDVASFTSTVFSNMWDNVSNFFSNVWAWLSGSETNWEWKGLTDGFESTMEALPKIAERHKGDLEKALETELGGLVGGLSEDFDRRLAKNKEATEELFGVFSGTSGEPKTAFGDIGTDLAVSDEFAVTTGKGGAAKKEKAKAGAGADDGSFKASFEGLDATFRRISAAAASTKKTDPVEKAVTTTGLVQTRAVEAVEAAVGLVQSAIVETTSVLSQILKETPKPGGLS